MLHTALEGKHFLVGGANSIRIRFQVLSLIPGISFHRCWTRPWRESVSWWATPSRSPTSPPSAGSFAHRASLSPLLHFVLCSMCCTPAADFRPLSVPQMSPARLSAVGYANKKGTSPSSQVVHRRLHVQGVAERERINTRTSSFAKPTLLYPCRRRWSSTGLPARGCLMWSPSHAAAKGGRRLPMQSSFLSGGPSTASPTRGCQTVEAWVDRSTNQC